MGTHFVCFSAPKAFKSCKKWLSIWNWWNLLKSSQILKFFNFLNYPKKIKTTNVENPQSFFSELKLCLKNPPKVQKQLQKSDWVFETGEICWNQAKFWNFSIFQWNYPKKKIKTTNVENPQSFFSELKLCLKNPQKYFGRHICWTKVLLKKFLGRRVNVRFKRDWHEMVKKVKTNLNFFQSSLWLWETRYAF